MEKTKTRTTSEVPRTLKSSADARLKEHETEWSQVGIA